MPSAPKILLSSGRLSDGGNDLSAKFHVVNVRFATLTLRKYLLVKHVAFGVR